MMVQKSIRLCGAVLLLASCNGQFGPKDGGNQEEIREFEIVKKVSEPQVDSIDFTEDLQGTPIEGRQGSPRDGLVRESSKEDEALWE